MSALALEPECEDLVVDVLCILPHFLLQGTDLASSAVLQELYPKGLIVDTNLHSQVYFPASQGKARQLHHCGNTT